MSRLEKRSLTLRGHRTSVTLEPEFWAALRALAAVEGRSVNALAAEIDERRTLGGDGASLASAIRVHLLAAAREGRC
ncbi:MAG: ribbon-helix-helix domain-containing protein [Pseudomonadota bacterium]